MLATCCGEVSTRIQSALKSVVRQLLSAFRETSAVRTLEKLKGRDNGPEDRTRTTSPSGQETWPLEPGSLVGSHDVSTFLRCLWMLIEALRTTKASQETDMNKTFQTAIAAIVLAGAASGARADLTIDGAVGLPLNPTAQIPQTGGVRLQANYYDQGDVSGGGFNASQKTYGLVAAGRVGDMIEINGGVLRDKVSSNFPGANNTDTGIAIGAKYLFSRESDPVGVRFAAGVGYNDVQAKNTYVYGVATKYLGAVTEGRVPVTGHLGLRYDRFKQGGSSNKASVYGGLEVPFGGSFAAVGELQSKRISGGETPYSASIRFRPQGSPFSGSVGIARTGIGLDKGLFAQIGYSFDAGSNGQ